MTDEVIRWHLSGRDDDGQPFVVTPGSEAEGSSPSRLFTTRIEPTPHVPRYAVTRDGQRFLGLEQLEGNRNVIAFLLNWLEVSSAEGVR